MAADEKVALRGKRAAREKQLGMADKLTNMAYGEAPPHDPDWFLKSDPVEEPAVSWNPALIGYDVLRGLFADMMYNSHRSLAFGVLVFMFSVACVLLWIVGEEFWAEDLVPQYKFSYDRPLPTTVTTGMPFTFRVRVTDTNTYSGTEEPIAGVNVSLTGIPTGKFALNLEYAQEGSEVLSTTRTREVDCMRYMYGDPTAWNFQDKELCHVDFSQTSVLTDGDGYAEFKDVVVRRSPETLVTMVLAGAVAAGKVRYLRTIMHVKSAVALMMANQDSKFPPVSLVNHGEEIAVSFRAYMRFDPAAFNKTKPRWAEDYSFVAINAAVDGRFLTRQEFVPMDHPGADRYARYEIVSLTVAEEPGLLFTPEDAFASVVYQIRYKPVWFIGANLYPALFFGTGLMYLGPVFDDRYTAPFGIAGHTIFLPPPRPVLAMATALPHSLVEGRYLTVEFTSAGGGRPPTVLAKVVSYNGDPLAPYWLDPTRAPMSQTFKTLVHPLAEPVQDAAGKWVLQLRLAFSTAGRVGRYGVTFHCEHSTVAPRLAGAGGAGGDVWYVDAETSAHKVESDLKSTVATLMKGGVAAEQLAVGVGVPQSAPSVIVLNADGVPVPGKTVQVVADDPTALGIAAHSKESDAVGSVTFADFRFTFATREGGHRVKFYVDGVLGLDVEFQVRWRNASRVQPAHLEVDGVGADGAHSTQYVQSVRVRALNAYGEPVANVSVLGRVGYGDRFMPPAGFSPEVDPGKVGARESAAAVTDAAGWASVPMWHVGGGMLVPLTFTAVGTDEALIFPTAPGQGGYIMYWPPRRPPSSKLPEFTAVDLPNGLGKRLSLRSDYPVGVHIAAYPLHLNRVHGLQPYKDWTGVQIDKTLDISAVAGAGKYLLCLFSDGRWLYDADGQPVCWGAGVASPVAEVKVVQDAVPVVDQPGVMKGDGTPFEVQPAVQLLDKNGAPVVGGSVTAFLIDAKEAEGKGTKVAHKNPLFYREALKVGVLRTFDEGTNATGRAEIKEMLRDVSLGGELRLRAALDSVLGAVSANYLDGRTVDALARLSKHKSFNAISAVSDANGVARFAALGAINPKTDTPLRIVYMHHDPDLFTIQKASFVGDTAYKAVSLVPPQPASTTGSPLAVPPSAVLVDEKGNLCPFLFGYLYVQPRLLADATKRVHTTFDGVPVNATGAMIAGGFTFDQASDPGNYEFRFALPGGELKTAPISVHRHPSVLEVVTSPPPIILGGNGMKVAVAAKFADGSRLAGVPIKATFYMLDNWGAKITCVKCKTVSLYAETDARGVATFYPGSNNAVQGRYVVEFEASRGQTEFALAEFDLENARQRASNATKQYAGKSAPAWGPLGPFLEEMLEHGADFVTDFLETSALPALDKIKVETTPTYVLNGVTKIGIDTHPRPQQETEVDVGNATLFNLTFSDAEMTIYGLAKGEWGQHDGLENFAVSVVNVHKAGTRTAEPDVKVGWDKGRTGFSDKDGKLTLKGLWVAAARKATLGLTFGTRGTYSEEVTFTIEAEKKKKSAPSIYVRAAIIVGKMVPWLFANVPFTSVLWVPLSFGLAAALPFIINALMKEVFTSHILFIRLAMWFTAGLWGLIILSLLYELFRLVTGRPTSTSQRIQNDYRYARWMTKMIPFSSIPLVQKAKYRKGLAGLGPVQGLLAKYYLWAVQDKLADPECPLPVDGDETRLKPTWTRTSGAITLHRHPGLYHQPHAAMLHCYGAHFGAAPNPRGEVALRVRGALPEELAALVPDEEEKATGAVSCLLQDIAGLLGAPLTAGDDEELKNVADVRVIPSDAPGAYATVVATVVEAAGMAEKVEELAGMQLETTAAQCESGGVAVDAVLKYTPAAERRDNDEEWTWADSRAVWWHFYCAPVLIEEERVEDYEAFPERRELIDGVGQCQRVWIRHRMPPGILRSNGQPFPDFWSPNYNAESDPALLEDNPEDWVFEELDNMTSEEGGRPEGVEDPVRLPFRFLVSAGVAFVTILFIAFFFFYITGKFRDKLRELYSKIPNPAEDGPIEGQLREDLNALLRTGISAALHTVSKVSPSFAVLRTWLPQIEGFDFVWQWERLYRVAGNTMRSVEKATIFAACISPVIAAFGWVGICLATPGNVRALRRNEPGEPLIRQNAQCKIGDYYVGMQSLSGAVNYAIVFVLLFLIGCILFNPSILPWVWNKLKKLIWSIITGMIIKLIIDTSTALIWAPGVSVRFPTIYQRVQVVSSVVSLVGGAMATIVRLGMSIGTQILMFPRLDLRSIPGPFGFLDKGYWSYWSMLYVDEMHNNPLLRVFAGIVLTEYTFKRAAKEADAAAPPPAAGGKEGCTALVRVVARKSRASEEYAPPPQEDGAEVRKLPRCAIGGVRFYTDAEIVDADGLPLARQATTGAEDLRFFRSLPEGAVTTYGRGCSRCGAPAAALPSYFPFTGAAVRYLRAVTARRWNDAHGREQIAWEDWQGRVSVENAASDTDTATWVTRLAAPAEVTQVELTPLADALAKGGAAEAAAEVETAAGTRWILLGSLEGETWRVMAEGEAAGNAALRGVHAAGGGSVLALCGRCHAKRRPAEGQPRVLVPVAGGLVDKAHDATGGDVAVSLGESFFAEVTLPSAECRIRGYALQTAAGAADDDLTSWVLAVADTTYAEYVADPAGVRWSVQHEALEAPMPTVRGMYTNPIGMWTSPAAYLNQPRMMHMLRFQYPFMKELVKMRLAHLTGEASMLTGPAEAAEEEEAEPTEPVAEGTEPRAPGPVARVGVYTSLLEAGSFRNTKRKGLKLWMGYMLVMNPSLLGYRKAGTRDASGEAPTVSKLKVNAKALRERVNRRVWRASELLWSGGAAAKASSPNPPAGEKDADAAAAPAAPGIAITCAAAPAFTGHYEKGEEHCSQCVPVAAGCAVVALDASVQRVTRALLGGVDVTDAFAGFMGGAVDLAGRADAADTLHVYYTRAVYRKLAASTHTARGAAGAHDVRTGAVLRYQNGAWRVSLPAPAPGFQYPCLVSEPAVHGAAPPAGLAWHAWSPAVWGWEACNVDAVDVDEAAGVIA